MTSARRPALSSRRPPPTTGRLLRPAGPPASGRHFGLDLVRALAIAMVVLSHLDHVFKLGLGWLGVPAGILGVELFFVLSGLLIGDILLRDTAAAFGRQVLWRFWLRRWLRTLPAYATTIAVVFLALGNGSWLYLVFAQNISPVALELLPPSWSLSVEEWFYVLFPPALMALRLRLPARPAFLAGVTAFLLVPPALRFGLTLCATLPFNDFYYRFPPLRLDAPALGLLLAWLRRYTPAAWARLSGRRTMLLAGLALWTTALLLIAADVNSRTASAPELAGLAMSTAYLPLLSAGCAAILLWLHGMPRWPASLWLRLPVLFGSRLSYSLYLVHLPVFTLWAARISNRLTAAGTLGVIGAALLATLLLHRLVEAPCIALRDRMRPCPPAPQASQATQSGATQSA